MKPPFATQLNRAHPLAAGLIGAWLLNEGSGTRVLDISGGDHHGVLTDMETSDWMAGPFGWSLDFAGVDRVAINGASISQLNGRALTVASLATSELTGVTFGRLVDRVYNGQFALYYRHAAGNGLAYALATAGGSVDVASPNVFFASSGQPFLAVMTYDGIAGRLYANGRLVHTQTSGIGGNLLSSADDIFLGNRIGGNRAFDGQIHAAWLWARVLSEDEVCRFNRDPFAMARRNRSMIHVWSPPTSAMSLMPATQHYRRLRCS